MQNNTKYPVYAGVGTGFREGARVMGHTSIRMSTRVRKGTEFKEGTGTREETGVRDGTVFEGIGVEEGTGVREGSEVRERTGVRGHIPSLMSHSFVKYDASNIVRGDQGTEKKPKLKKIRNPKSKMSMSMDSGVGTEVRGSTGVRVEGGVRGHTATGMESRVREETGVRRGTGVKHLTQISRTSRTANDTYSVTHEDILRPLMRKTNISYNYRKARTADNTYTTNDTCNITYEESLKPIPSIMRNYNVLTDVERTGAQAEVNMYISM
jgi:hypothetical protein